MTRRTLACALLLVACACTGGRAPTGQITIVVNVPVAKGGSVASQIVRGAQLAAAKLNDAGGVKAGNAALDVVVKTMDTDYSPARSAENVREAMRLGASAVIDEGTGVDAEHALAPGTPICIVVQGGMSLVDPATRRNVFRIAPTDRGVSFRLAEYLVPKNVTLAALVDDSTYGNGGAVALARAFKANPGSLLATIRVPAGATDVAPQVLEARRSGAKALLVWARAPVLALAIRAARQAGWTAPVYAGTSGEDPLVRQQLADRPAWVEGMTFAGSRLTSERGAAPYEAFRAAYEKRFGVERTGVKAAGGREIVMPPTWAMYSYDFVLVLANAITHIGNAQPGAALVGALEGAVAQGANGDLRGFTPANHEGVLDDDVYFAVIRDMQFQPVDDDALSATLPKVSQEAR